MAYDRVFKEKRAIVLNGQSRITVYEDKLTAERDARMLSTNPRYWDVEVEDYEYGVG